MRVWILLLLSLLISMPLGANDDALDRGFKKIRSKELKPGQSPDFTYLTSYALVVGINDYENERWSKLKQAITEADSVKQLLEDKGFQVRVLHDATKAEFVEELKDILDTWNEGNRAADKSRLVIYFAGHGHTVTLSNGEKQGYLVFKGAADPKTEPGSFVTEAWSMDEASAFANEVWINHVLFVFNSCFSGNIFVVPTRGADSSLDNPRYIKPVRQAITAGAAGELVRDNLTFFNVFAAGLRGAADGKGNRDGVITGYELGEYLERSPEIQKMKQTTQSSKLWTFGNLAQQGEILFESERDKEDAYQEFAFDLNLQVGAPAAATLTLDTTPPGTTSSNSLFDLASEFDEGLKSRVYWALDIRKTDTQDFSNTSNWSAKVDYRYFYGTYSNTAYFPASGDEIVGEYVVREDLGLGVERKLDGGWGLLGGVSYRQTAFSRPDDDGGWNWWFWRFPDHKQISDMSRMHIGVSKANTEGRRWRLAGYVKVVPDGFFALEKPLSWGGGLKASYALWPSRIIWNGLYERVRPNKDSDGVWFEEYGMSLSWWPGMARVGPIEFRFLNRYEERRPREVLKEKVDISIHVHLHNLTRFQPTY